MDTKYKDSGVDWIGKIPEEWNVVPFRSYVKERAEKNKDEKTRELLALSFALGVTLYKDKVFNMDRVKENYEDYQLVYENDLVLSPNDIIKGSVFVSKYYGCISPMYLVFSARNTDSHYLPYLSYLLRTSVAGRKFFFLARGLIGSILDNGKYVTRRMTVSKQDLLSFDVLLPPLTTQQRIVDFLDRKCAEIDELAALQQTMIDELKRYKQSLITETVTKGLDKNAKMKDSGVEWIGEIPEHWEVKRMKDVLKQPLQYGANESGIPFNENLPRYVRITDISDNSLREDLIKQSLTEEQAEGYILEDNDILFARSGGTVGKAFIYRQSYGRCAFAGYLIKAAIQRENAQYVYYYTQTHCYDEWKRRIFIQATIQNIGADKYSIMELPIPLLDEQQQIADYLDEKCAEIDELIAVKQQKIEALKEYKKSVIFEYVTGKSII